MKKNLHEHRKSLHLDNMAQESYPEESLNQLIKLGQIEKAKALLRTIALAKLSPIDLSLHCSFLRRVGQPDLALKILRPLVYPKSRSAQTASPLEVIEYAACLVRLQILGEAETLLKAVDQNRFPIVLMRIAFIKIAQWDFASSNAHLEKYLSLIDQNSYEHLVARVNYVQGLVYQGELKAGLKYARPLIDDLKKKNAALLLSAVHEFCSEAYRQQRNFKQAKQEINLGLSLSIPNSSTDYFLLKRQSLINEIHEFGISDSLKESFDSLLKEAISRRHFESHRELLLHQALVAKNSQQLTQIFWQTRSFSLKKRILSLAKEHSITINQESFVCSLGDLGAKAERKKIFSIEQDQLKENLKTTSLFYALLDEGFKPQYVTDLFNEIYPEELYIPFYSKEKIHQLVFQLKKIIELNKWPLKLCFSKSKGFHFKFLKPILLQERKKVRSSEVMLLRKALDAEQAYTFKALCKLFKCSPRTMNRKLRKLIDNEEIIKTGSTTSVRYFVRAAQ